MKKKANKKMKRFIYLLIIFLSGAIGTVFAQYSTVEKTQEFGGEKQGASSILTNRNVNGRFGMTSSGGYLSPSPDKNSRLNSGAVFSKSGSFIGIDNNTPNSRFQEYWNKPIDQESSQNSFNEYLSALKNRRDRENFQSDLSALNAPQAVQASPVETQPFRSAANLNYFSSDRHSVGTQASGSLSDPSVSSGTRVQNFRDQPLRNQNSGSAGGYNGPQYFNSANSPAMNSGSVNSRQSGSVNNPSNQTSNGFPQNSGVISPSSQSLPSYNNTSNNGNGSGVIFKGGVGDSVPNTGGSRIVGGLSSPVSGNPPVNSTALPTAVPMTANQQNPTAAFQEYLELMLLRSPEVNPLSPVKVTFSNGIATVQGIVPTQNHKLAAGKILLSDSRVKSVDNRLSVMPSDPNAPLPPVFDPNLQETK